MKSIQEYTILWNATESGTFIIQVMRQRERNNMKKSEMWSKIKKKCEIFSLMSSLYNGNGQQ
ncbi:CLUMA_CG007379, isoform A [Clunio marinus]|uniref:CLUMA_CG007379, isoform A n=1 Tax=Clunio marinus TaxID=568069 RepID=A0A1J1I2N6_9DIPT|nr:CLUMA_CG007379, isoform A [Clunio marinus]